MFPESKETGWYGINLHNGYSAGCQVVKSPSDLTKVLETCEKQIENGHIVYLHFD